MSDDLDATAQEKTRRQLAALKHRVLPYHGRSVSGISLEFQGDGERWQNYLCEDGTMVKVKLSVAEIVRVTNEFDQDGNPLYIACSRVIVQPVVPMKEPERRDD